MGERDVADQFLNVDPAVSQRAALSVGFGDFGLEGDDSFETGLEIRHQRFLSSSSWVSEGTPRHAEPSLLAEPVSRACFLARE